MNESRTNEQRHADFANAKPELTVLSDLSLESSAGHLDNFDLRRRVGPVYDIIRHPDTQTPMTIAILGDWGSGKTSAMRWLRGLLEIWNTEGTEAHDDAIRVKTIWFEPWKYDNKGDVWRGLLAEVILASLGKEESKTDEVLRAVRDFGAVLGWGFLRSVKVRFAGIDIDWGAAISETPAPEAAYLNEFEDTMRQWVNEALEPDERMVVFIDDLDRCMPDIALQVLEALKLYLGIERLIFVVGVDRGVINDLVTQHYRKQGLADDKSRSYLDKMFQVEVSLASTDHQIEDFLAVQLASLDPWKDLGPMEQELFKDLVFKLADRNPREVKRLLNSAIVDGYGDIVKRRGEDDERRIEDEDRGEALSQGLQRFFLRRLLSDKGRASLLYQSIGQEFFYDWSLICSDLNLPAKPLTVPPITRPGDGRTSGGMESEADARTPAEYDEKALAMSAPEYVDLIKVWWTRSGAQKLIALMSDEDIVSLMRIRYPKPVTNSVPAPAYRRTGVDVQNYAIRDEVRHRLGKKSDQTLFDEDYLMLESLDLNGLDVCDLAPLTRLTNLKSLSLDGTKVSDVASLGSLTNLKRLSLEDTLVSDIAPLRSLANLVTLRLTRTDVSDVGPLTYLSNLKSLWLAGTGVTGYDIINLKRELPRLKVFPKDFGAEPKKR